jgi:transcriptional regulator with XRE-family HTH domain
VSARARGGPDEAPSPGDPAYAREVGVRLRDVRRQHGLSLQQVSARSGGVFGTSILGAYERGERALSVGRLSALAELYGIPTWFLLPQPADGGGPPPAMPPPPPQVTIDLARLAREAAPEGWTLIRRYVASIQRQRGDLNGRVLSLRLEDLRIMASFYAMGVADLLDRLREDGILSPR